MVFHGPICLPVNSKSRPGNQYIVTAIPVRQSGDADFQRGGTSAAENDVLRRILRSVIAEVFRYCRTSGLVPDTGGITVAKTFLDDVEDGSYGFRRWL